MSRWSPSCVDRTPHCNAWNAVLTLHYHGFDVRVDIAVEVWVNL
jgi:hypothetical protein